MSDSYEFSECGVVYISSDSENASPEPLGTPSPIGRPIPLQTQNHLNPGFAPLSVEPATAQAPRRGPQSTDWCFTCNNPSPADFAAFDNAVALGKCTYCCYALEHAAPTDGT